MVFNKMKQWLNKFSFRTGLILALLCVVCYTVSFAQMLLPVSVTVKGLLWIVFFGLAKTFQYGALMIWGATGLARAKAIFKRLE